MYRVSSWGTLPLFERGDSPSFKERKGEARCKMCTSARREETYPQEGRGGGFSLKEGVGGLPTERGSSYNGCEGFLGRWGRGRWG